MTGYTVHTGSNENFSSGWDAIFGRGKTGKKKSAAKAAKKPAAKKAGKSSKKK